MLPGVTVVLPVRGRRLFAEGNWRSQLELQYPGPLEFVFVSHSRDDVAFDTIEKLLSKLAAADTDIRARVLASGRTQKCSQKIHNLCHGIQAASSASKYVLCLDDDVQLHRSTLTTLVQRLESDPQSFLATGYPFDVPPPGAGLLTYCMLVYHLPLLIAFSVREETFNVWGGCMLMPLRHLQEDTYGIMRAWRDGGYSDDLTVASKCNQHNLRICCPPDAIFTQYLEPHITCAQFWNYIRRQTYVLDTYSDSFNRRMNWSLLAFSAYGSFFISMAMLLGGVMAVALFGACLTLLSMHFTPMQKPATASALVDFVQGTSCPTIRLVALATWASLAAAYASCWIMCTVVIKLLNTLSPAKPPLPMHVISHPKIWLGLFLQLLMQPVVILTTLISPDITWSGIKYWKQNGKVARIQFMGDQRCERK